VSGLDTTTLTGTNIPDIAARIVEGSAQTLLYAPLRTAFEAFWAAIGLSSYTFYADGTGASLVLSTEAKALMAVLRSADPSTGWPAGYYTTVQGIINARIMADYADQPSKIINIGV